MTFCVIIPARLNSTRLANKVLLDIAGMPMIRHVYEIAKSSGANRVIIATDSVQVEQVARQFGADVCMTSPEHPSGTARIAEVISQRKLSPDTIIVNLQGDEPLMPGELVRQVAANLRHYQDAQVATLCEPIKYSADLLRTNIVKVVLDKHNYAMYFSRAPIPWVTTHFQSIDLMDTQTPMPSMHYRHMGLYAYTAGFASHYATLPACDYEKAESLEQLRILWHGYKIHVGLASKASGPGVDTTEDLERVREIYTSVAMAMPCQY